MARWYSLMMPPTTLMMPPTTFRRSHPHCDPKDPFTGRRRVFECRNLTRFIGFIEEIA